MTRMRGPDCAVVLQFNKTHTYTHTHAHTHTVVDAMWETGETSAERKKNVDKKGLVQ